MRIRCTLERENVVKPAMVGLVLLLLPLASVAAACEKAAEDELQQQIEELRERIQSTIDNIEGEVEDLRQRAESATQEERRDIEEQIDRLGERRQEL